MTDNCSVTARVTFTIEVDWPSSYGENAKAIDIYTTAARECGRILHHALTNDKVSYRMIGEPEAKMVILPVRKP